MNLKNLSESELGEHIQSQPNGIDEPTFKELYRRYKMGLSKILYSQAPNIPREFRDDSLQKAWCDIYKKAHTLRDARAIEAWIFRVGKNQLFDDLRAKNRISLVSIDRTMGASYSDEGDDWQIPDGRPPLMEEIRSHEMVAEIKKRIEELREPFRTAVRLQHLENLKYEEIAQITGATVGTVKSRIARGRAKLQKELRGLHEELGAASVRKGKVVKADSETVELIGKLWREGGTNTSIALKLGMTAGMVCHRIAIYRRNYGLPAGCARPDGVVAITEQPEQLKAAINKSAEELRAKAEEIEKVGQLWLQGYTAPQIGRELGMTKDMASRRIRRYRQNHGLPTSGPRPKDVKPISAAPVG